MDQLHSIFSTAHRRLKPRTPLPVIQVEFFPFAGLNHTARLREGRLVVRVSDIFTDAPDDVVHSLALLLLAKLYRKKVDSSHQRIYRLFILRTDIQERARIARNNRARSRRGTGPQGRHVDLDPIFDRVNVQYFNGSLQKPRLSWTPKRSRYVLGRYDVAHDTIYITRLFDAPDVPALVTEYVMFHEMLHLKHQSRVLDCRVIVHTTEFRKEEQRFLYYREAKLWLKGT